MDGAPLGATVLVVDDQPVNRVVMSQLLRSLNLNVIEACDGQQGLQKYLQCGRAVISFVFLDLMMPVWDGFKAALSIRSAESRQGWLPVPIVAFTSEDVRHGSPLWTRCMCSGFNDVVPKPMDRQHTTEMLFRWVPGLQYHSVADGSSGNSSSGGSSSGGSSGSEAQGACDSLPTNKCGTCHSQGSSQDCSEGGAPLTRVASGSLSSGGTCSSSNSDDADMDGSPALLADGLQKLPGLAARQTG